MGVSIFGLLVLLVGGYLLARGTVAAMLAFVMACGLLGGAAAIFIPIGNAAIPPANLSILFLLLRLLLPQRGQRSGLGEGALLSTPLLVFAIYGFGAALVLPHLFAGSIMVTPLKVPPKSGLYPAYPLAFSPQNVTSALYLVGTAVTCICACAAALREGSWRIIARTAAVIALVHGLLGIASVAANDTPAELLFNLFRNNNHIQVDQQIEGLSRMNGIFPEPAIYSSFGFSYFVFVTELWLRRIEPRWTTPAMLVMGSALVMSTSTTAIIGLGAYAIIIAARQLMTGRTLSARRLVAVAAIVLVAVTGLVALAALRPEVVATLGDVLNRMLFEKAESSSGITRAFMARQGWDAFLYSGGLGIGPGSFRSSSLVTAIIGSVGIIGTIGFVVHLIRVFGPFRPSTFASTLPPREATGVAAAWASVVMLLPVSLTAPSPDPGVVWAIFSGTALGIRLGRPIAAGRQAAPAAALRPGPVPALARAQG